MRESPFLGRGPLKEPWRLVSLGGSRVPVAGGLRRSRELQNPSCFLLAGVFTVIFGVAALSSFEEGLGVVLAGAGLAVFLS